MLVRWRRAVPPASCRALQECDAARCCREEYECYGNCGDYTALYIFLTCVAVFVLACGVFRVCRAPRERDTITDLDSSTEPDAEKEQQPTPPEAAGA